MSTQPAWDGKTERRKPVEWDKKERRKPVTPEAWDTKTERRKEERRKPKGVKANEPAPTDDKKKNPDRRGLAAAFLGR